MDATQAARITVVSLPLVNQWTQVTFLAVLLPQPLDWIHRSADLLQCRSIAAAAGKSMLAALCKS